MPEMKVTITSDVGAGITLSFEFTRIVDSEEEAVEAGADDRKLIDWYMEGYGA